MVTVTAREMLSFLKTTYKRKPHITHPLHAVCGAFLLTMKYVVFQPKYKDMQKDLTCENAEGYGKYSNLETLWEGDYTVAHYYIQSFTSQQCHD